MSFDARIMAFAERFLSHRTFELVVEPALADLQFEHEAGPRRQFENRLAVLRAVAGGLRGELARGLSSFIALMLLPAGYYVFFLILCFDFLSIEISTSFVVVAVMILVLSFGPVAACFWPERPSTRPVD